MRLDDRATRASCAFLALALVLLAVACGPPAAPVETPVWGRTALATDDADLVGAMNLEGLRDDPLFGPLLEHLARQDDFGVLLRATQIDVAATVDAGEPVTWIAVVHGVDGPPGEHDVGAGLGAPRQLPTGAVEYPGARTGGLLTAPGAWILGEGAAFERMRGTAPAPVARIAMPRRALVASTVRGRAIPRPRREELVPTTEGLREATLEVLGGESLEFVLRCTYVDSASAKRAATAARLLLAAESERRDVAAVLARALVKIDFDVSGETVTSRVTINDDLRELLQGYVNRAARR